MDRIDNYYTATLNDHSVYAALDCDIDVDIAIVGGGFTGIATAVELAERGFSVAVCEANRIGWGATGRNGGQVTGSLSGDKAMLTQLRSTHGADAEEFIWHLRWEGHNIIRERIARYAIDCDLKMGHLQTAWKERDIPEHLELLELAHSYGMEDDVSWLSQADVHDILDTPLYHGGLLNMRNMHLHSLNLCLGEARAAKSLGVQIFEQTAVQDIKGGRKPALKTASGTINAKKIVLAGNAYHQLARKQLGGLLFPAILGNMTTEPLGAELAAQINTRDLAVYDSRMVLDYYRLTADNRLMFGGGTNYSGRGINDVAKILMPSLAATFPALKDIRTDYAWTGTAGIVMNRIPLVGKFQNNVYYAQGYSGHGIATSHIMAEVLAEALTGTLEKFDVFSGFSHTRVPGSQLFGNGMLALGMWYYQFKEKLNG